MQKGFLVLGSSLLLLACTDSDGDKVKPTGTEGGSCYGNGTCNPGLICALNICTREPDGRALDSSLSRDGRPDLETPGQRDGQMGADGRQVSTFVQVSGFIESEWLVEIEMEAIVANAET